jgi:hypothetical protein
MGVRNQYADHDCEPMATAPRSPLAQVYHCISELAQRMRLIFSHRGREYRFREIHRGAEDERRDTECCNPT